MEMQVATRQDIDEVLGILRDFMQAVDNRFNAFERRFNSLENRFNTLEFRFDGMGGRFDGLEARLERVEKSQDRVLTAMDGLVGRIDTYEIESAARDAKLDRLIRWAHKTGDITGVHLQND